MKIPKGFGKNYFSLSAICAYSNGISLQAQLSSYTHLSRNLSFETLEDEEDSLDDLELLLLEEPKPTGISNHFYLKNLLYNLPTTHFLHPFTFFSRFKTPLGHPPP